MKASFVLIFRQGGKELSEQEQKRRTEEVRTWALKHIENGQGLDPRILAPESSVLGDNPVTDSERKIIALNFIEAESFNEAVNVAQSHPGLRYGVSIEVRPWSDPRARRASAA